jgi:hypothetical protein
MLELIGDEEKMTTQEEEEREWGSLSLLTSERIVVPSILVTHILLFLSTQHTDCLLLHLYSPYSFPGEKKEGIFSRNQTFCWHTHTNVAEEMSSSSKELMDLTSISYII